MDDLSYKLTAAAVYTVVCFFVVVSWVLLAKGVFALVEVLY
jgi:hypothetical protein